MKLLVILLIAIVGNSAMAESINLELWAIKDIPVPAGKSETLILNNEIGSICMLKHDKRGFNRKIKIGSKFLIMDFTQRDMTLHEKSKAYIVSVGGIYNEEVAAKIKSEKDLVAFLRDLNVVVVKTGGDSETPSTPAMWVSRLELISSESGNNYSMDCVDINKKLSFDDIINLLLEQGSLVPKTDL